jgi:Protein of unknown function (DUF2844)
MQSSRSVRNVKKCVLFGGLLSCAFIPCIATAALGEPEASVQADLAELHGSITVAEHTNYRVHEIQLPSGTVVREFIGSGGTVFAIAWRGPTVPNLRQTLGRYFESYTAAARANRTGRHHLQINQSDLVVHAGGHMRAFSGVAYLPPAVPGGVNIGDLR